MIEACVVRTISLLEMKIMMKVPQKLTMVLFLIDANQINIVKHQTIIVKFIQTKADRPKNRGCLVTGDVLTTL